MTQSSHPLAKFLRAVGMSHEQFAKECDLSQPYISLLCARKRRPSPKTAQRVERVCNRIVERLDHSVLSAAFNGTTLKVPTASELVFARVAA